MRTIPITRGMVTIVDDGDYDDLSRYKWYAVISGRTAYAVRRVAYDGRSKILGMHRYLLGDPSGIEVDHINGDGLDNRRDNLRFATKVENQRNRTHKRLGCSSQYKGVTWHKRDRVWAANIASNTLTPDGKSLRVHLGYFENELDAARAYDAAAIKYFGEFAHTNLKDE